MKHVLFLIAAAMIPLLGPRANTRPGSGILHHGPQVDALNLRPGSEEARIALRRISSGPPLARPGRT